MEWEVLLEDDYGPNHYDQSAGWIVLKSIIFRVGDKVCTTEKIMKAKTIEVDARTTDESVHGGEASIKHNSRKRKSVDSGKEQSDDDYDSSDDDALVRKINRRGEAKKGNKKPVNARKANKRVTKNVMADNIMHVDATFYGVVVSVKHRENGFTITVVYATRVLDDVEEEVYLKEDIKTKEKLLALRRSLSDNRHYISGNLALKHPEYTEAALEVKRSAST